MNTTRLAADNRSTIPFNVRFAAVNEWHIPQLITDKWFDKYYILSWQGTWLADQVNNGTVMHDGVRFKINWITVPSLCYKASEVLLSYRRIWGQDEGYVLIKVKQ